jgi:hypothetical protein
MREKIFKTKYNLRTKRFKQINLERMTRETSDFVKHLNFVLSGTPYKICRVYEGRKKGNLNIYVTLFERGTFEESKDYGILLNNRGISVGDWSRGKYFSKKYKGKINDYERN